MAARSWVGPDGRRVCEDERALRFDADGDARWIDLDITMQGRQRAGCLRRYTRKASHGLPRWPTR